MEECIFCKIIDKKIQSEIVLENDKLIVIKDINPKADVHLLIIPKKHIPSLKDFRDEDKELLGELLMTANKLSEMFEEAKDGFKVAINVGKRGGQIIDHFHIHFLAGNLTSLP